MKRRFFTVVATPVVLVVVMSFPCFSQDLTVYNQISFLTEETGFGARALGLASAYIGVADDYSAIFWNPAGLALMKEKEFFASLVHNRHNINARLLGTPIDNTLSKTGFGSVGFAYPVTVYRGSLVFAGGFHKVHDYNSLFGYRVFNPDESYMYRTFVSPNVPDRLTQDEYVDIEGMLSQFSFACAYEAAEHFFIGATINLWLGENDYTQVYQELDTKKLYDSPPNDFKSYKNDGAIDTEINGYDATLGALYQYSPRVRFGAVVRTPRFLTLNEVWSVDETIVYDDPTVDPWQSSDNGEFQYKVRMPYMMGVGASYQSVGSLYPMLVTGEINYIDWQQIRFRDDFPVAGINKADANRAIKRTLASRSNYKIGFEFSLPQESQFRFGYMKVPNPVMDAADKPQDYLTFGFGTKIGTMGHIDIAYRHGWWNNNTVSNFSDILVNEKHTDDKLFATMSFRFK
jgi:long-chain fatty acid transport protein